LGITGISGIEITKKGVSPRIVELEIKKSDGTTAKMTGQDFRTKLGIKSAWVYRIGGTFPDVPIDFWAFGQVEYLSEKGIIQGYADGTFKPSAIVTRGQFVKMLAVALNIPATGKSNFTDTSGNWADPYIAALSSKSIVNGFEDGSFRPDVMITRAEICAIIARAKALSKGSINVTFNDTSNHWALNMIDIVASNGIVTGYTGGEFKPDAGATRAEVVAMIYRMLTASN
jgi:hypothetical protein